MAEPRLALVEQHLVAVQGKLNHYEEQQQRLLQGIEQIVTELVDKATKARGGRGAEVLQTATALSNIFSNALIRIEQEIDKRMPNQVVQSSLKHSSDVEQRLQLIETHLSEVQPSTCSNTSHIETEVSHLKELLGKELARIHQTTFSFGDFGTPFNQLQQKVMVLDSEVKSIKRVDTTQLAEATVKTAISNFQQQLDSALAKMVSAEQLYKFKDDISRLQDLCIESQTRAHTLLTRTSQIEAYSKSLIETQFSTYYDGLVEKIHTLTDSLQDDLVEKYKTLEVSIKEKFLRLYNHDFEELRRLLFEHSTEFYHQVEKKMIDKNTKYVEREVKSINQLMQDTFRKKIAALEQEFDQKINTKFFEQKIELKQVQSKTHTTVETLLSQVDVLKSTIVQLEQKIKSHHANPPVEITPNVSVPLRTPTITMRHSPEYTSLTKCFYTAIFAVPGKPADTLPAIMPIHGWDYICFTNIPSLQQRGWTIQVVDMPSSSPIISAKQYKWLSHNYLIDYDVVIWMDAYLAPNPAEERLLASWIIDMMNQNLLIGHREHKERKCIYEECDAVIKGKRDTPANVDRVRGLLQLHKMPKEYGLFDTNLVIRFHKYSIVQQLGEAIFEQLRTVSTRDQLAVTLHYFLQKFKQYSTYPLHLAWEKRGVHVRIPAF